MARKQLGTNPTGPSHAATKGYTDNEISEMTLTSSQVVDGLGYTPESPSNKGIANGYASLDGGGKIPVSQLPSSIMQYQGTYNASTNTPSLANGTGDTGDVYRVSVAGTQNFGAGSISFEVGDYVIYNGSVWEKSDTTDAVSTVAGLTGDVTASSLRTAMSAITRSVQTITAPTTLGSAANTDYVYFLGASGTPTLPTAVGNTNQYTLKNISGSTITYSTTSSETVDGSPSGAGDASYSSVVALLSGDGANDATAITDSSPSASNWTVSGAAKLKTATKKYGTASIYTDGTSSTFIRAASNITLGTNYTVEFWVYFVSVPADAPIFDFRDASNTSNANVTLNAAQKFEWYTNSAAIITGTTTAVANTWYHVAVCRSGSSVKLYINGTQEGSTATNSTSFGATKPTIGARYSDNYNTNAYWDDIRITNAARYTANFTAPTSALPSGAGTSISTGAVVRLISDGSNWRTW